MLRTFAGLIKTVPSSACTSTDRATGCRCVVPSGRNAAVPWFFSGCTDPRHRYVAPSNHNVAARGPSHPEVVRFRPSRGCTDPRAVAASPHPVIASVARGPRRCPKIVPAAAPTHEPPLRRPFGPQRRGLRSPPSPRPACRRYVAPSGPSAAARGPLRRPRAPTSRDMRRVVSLGARTPLSAPVFVTLSGFLPTSSIATTLLT